MSLTDKVRFEHRPEGGEAADQEPMSAGRAMSDGTPEESSHGGDVSGVVEEQQGSAEAGSALLR